jgi:hypothetical protein
MTPLEKPRSRWEDKINRVKVWTRHFLEDGVQWEAKRGEVLDQLNDYILFKIESSPWSLWN